MVDFLWGRNKIAIQGSAGWDGEACKHALERSNTWGFTDTRYLAS